MKKQTIIKMVISIVIFISIICLEIFGLNFLRDEEILFCNSNQSIDIKEELSDVTGALPNTGTYSIKVVTKNIENIDIYYMYDGKVSNYQLETSSLNMGSEINGIISMNAVDGEIIYYGIIAGTVILLGILITYAFISKKPIQRFIKLGYFIFSLLVLVFLLCVVPMLSKNHGGDIYYYTVILGTYLIGFLYGYKNKAFFIPTIFMIPICFAARWFNYRHALLGIENICAYIFLKFIGALTGRILAKNKGIKLRNFIFYAIVTCLLFIGKFAYEIKPRTATNMISDCCEMALLGILYSIILFALYIIINKLYKTIHNNKNEKMAEKSQETAVEDKKESANIDEKKVKNGLVIVEGIIVIVLIIIIIATNIILLKPNSYIETNLQSYAENLDEQYGYRIIQEKVYVTCDNGREWIEVPMAFSNLYPSDRKFSSDSYYLDSNKLIFETSNGEFIKLIYSDDNGETWQNGTITDTNGYIVYMKFFDKENGIAMICYGNELGQREHLRASVTHDGGKTWATQKGDNSSVIINRGAEIEFTSMEEGKIENIYYDGSKTVYVTENAGLTWNVE